MLCVFFFSSRRRHTSCALVTGVQTCALPIYLFAGDGEGQWLDRPIAEELARAKLEEAAEAIMQLGTLGWVRVLLAQHIPQNETEGLHEYYIRRGELSDEDKARMTAIEERLQARSEEHTSELPSLMRISYAVFCLKKKSK